MTIETTLSRDQLVRISILRHFQRTPFYVYAALCAAATGYALFIGPPIFLLLGWVPFLLYILLGVVGAIQAGRAKDAPYFLPTRYEFTQEGVTMSTARGQSRIPWKNFDYWQKIAGCYVLILKSRLIIAIPQSAIPAAQVSTFEGMLRKQIDKRS